MPNRRGFLQAGIAVSFLPVLSRSTLAASAPIVFDQVVFDQRFAVARDFARRAQQAGLKCAVIQGDITDLYFHNLALRWKSGTTTIAGITTKGSLFCLEMLARDRGMRLVYSADVLDSQPLLDLPFDLADRKPISVSIIGQNPESPIAWVIAPRVRAAGGI